MALLSAAAAVAALGARDAEAGDGPLAGARPAPLERTEVAAARIGRRIYVVGGFERGSGETTAATERYDIRRDRWSRARPMPVALNHPAAVAHRGRLYVHGGYRAARDLSQPTAALLEYDPGRRRWRRLPDCAHRASRPRPRRDRRAALRGRRSKRLGLAPEPGDLRHTPPALAPGPSFPGPARNHTTGVATGGHFYVLAGRDAGNYAAAERYDPARRRWERLPDLGTPRGGIASVRLPDGRIVVFGGEDLAPAGPPSARWSCSTRDAGAGGGFPTCAPRGTASAGRRSGGRVFAIQGGVQPGLHLLERDRDAPTCAECSPSGTTSPTGGRRS